MGKRIKDETYFVLNCKKENYIIFMEFIDLYPELKREAFENFFKAYKTRNHQYTNRLKKDITAIFDFFRYAEDNKIYKPERFFNIDITEWNNSDYSEYFFNLRYNWNNILTRINHRNTKLFRGIKDIEKLEINFE